MADRKMAGQLSGQPQPAPWAGLSEDEILRRMGAFNVATAMLALLERGRTNGSMTWSEVCEAAGVEPAPGYTDARSGADVDGAIFLEILRHSGVRIDDAMGGVEPARFRAPSEP